MLEVLKKRHFYNAIAVFNGLPDKVKTLNEKNIIKKISNFDNELLKKIVQYLFAILLFII